MRRLHLPKRRFSIAQSCSPHGIDLTGRMHISSLYLKRIFGNSSFVEGFCDYRSLFFAINLQNVSVASLQKSWSSDSLHVIVLLFQASLAYPLHMHATNGLKTHERRVLQENCDSTHRRSLTRLDFPVFISMCSCQRQLDSVALALYSAPEYRSITSIIPSGAR